MFKWFLILCLFPSALYCQNDLDTRISKYNDSLHHYSKLNEEWYEDIAHLYFQKGEYDSAKQYFIKFSQSEILSKDPEERAFCMNDIGAAYYSMGQIDSGIYYYERAKNLLIALGNKARVALININIGIIYKNRGLYDKALQHLFEGVEYFENETPSRALSSCYSTIATVHSRQGAYNDAFTISSIRIANQEKPESDKASIFLTE